MALQAALDRVTATGAVAEVRQGSAVWRGSSGRSRLNGRHPPPSAAAFAPEAPGLRDTRLPGSSPFHTGPYSNGYEPLEKGDGTPVPVGYTTVNMSVAGTADEIISTTVDLDHFFRTLLSDDLLRPAELHDMTTDTAATAGATAPRKRRSPAAPSRATAATLPATAPSPSTHSTAPAK
ncbi:hypothetical protein ACFWP7_31415 [Streptomyces sp. NPDC058470]|uniref:hypothetical protein n=1 Tax=Streptomyces sp. NPDC058470 TaxID=3346515 RepID=UPI00365B0656